MAIFKRDGSKRSRSKRETKPILITEERPNMDADLETEIARESDALPTSDRPVIHIRRLAAPDEEVNDERQPQAELDLLQDFDMTGQLPLHSGGFNLHTEFSEERNSEDPLLAGRGSSEDASVWEAYRDFDTSHFDPNATNLPPVHQQTSVHDFAQLAQQAAQGQFIYAERIEDALPSFEGEAGTQTGQISEAMGEYLDTDEARGFELAEMASDTDSKPSPETYEEAQMEEEPESELSPEPDSMAAAGEALYEAVLEASEPVFAIPEFESETLAQTRRVPELERARLSQEESELVNEIVSDAKIRQEVIAEAEHPAGEAPQRRFFWQRRTEPVHEDGPERHVIERLHPEADGDGVVSIERVPIHDEQTGLEPEASEQISEAAAPNFSTASITTDSEKTAEIDLSSTRYAWDETGDFETSYMDEYADHYGEEYVEDPELGSVDGLSDPLENAFDEPDFVDAGYSHVPDAEHEVRAFIPGIYSPRAEIPMSSFGELSAADENLIRVPQTFSFESPVEFNPEAETVANSVPGPDFAGSYEYEMGPDVYDPGMVGLQTDSPPPLAWESQEDYDAEPERMSFWGRMKRFFGGRGASQVQMPTGPVIQEVLPRQAQLNKTPEIQSQRDLPQPSFRNRNPQYERLRQRDPIDVNFARRRALSSRQLDILELPEAPVYEIPLEEKELNSRNMLLPARIDVFKDQSQRSSRLYEALSWLRSLLLAILIGVVLVQYVVHRSVVDGRSMDPTLHNGDQLIVEKVSRYFSLPAYGEIITFRHPDTEHRPKDYLVKRVIGLPGDLIQIKEGGVYRNGEKLTEDYLDRSVQTLGVERGFDEVLVPEGEVYVLGDNRGVSSDSRYFGSIDASLIEGHVLMRFYPFQDFGFPR
ncbi:MAG: signal peptidase I [Eubacteriales bacterium]|nr:signal peptidase I [Eubacteriales bacterium]